MESVLKKVEGYTRFDKAGKPFLHLSTGKTRKSRLFLFSFLLFKTSLFRFRHEKREQGSGARLKRVQATCFAL